MSVVAVGVDVSTRKLAFGVLEPDGSHSTRTVVLSQREPARLFAEARSATTLVARRLRDAVVFAVEIPIMPAFNLKLVGVAVVVAEALQTARPDAGVLTPTPGAWKKASVGFGNAAKHQVMGHADFALGYHGDDQDVADALCVAEYARAEWLRATKSFPAVAA